MKDKVKDILQRFFRIVAHSSGFLPNRRVWKRRKAHVRKAYFLISTYI